MSIGRLDHVDWSIGHRGTVHQISCTQPTERDRLKTGTGSTGHRYNIARGASRHGSLLTSGGLFKRRLNTQQNHMGATEAAP